MSETSVMSQLANNEFVRQRHRVSIVDDGTCIDFPQRRIEWYPIRTSGIIRVGAVLDLNLLLQEGQTDINTRCN